MYINKSKVINAYGEVERASNSTKNSFEIVATVLDELKRSMIIVSEISEKKKPEVKEREKSNSKFSRACIAIYALQTSLDFEKGGNIAIQLFRVYEFCRKQLIKAFTKKVVDGINRAIITLSQIISAWRELLGKNATI